MEENITYGKLLTIIIIIFVPCLFWGINITQRINKIEQNYNIISLKILKTLDEVSYILNYIDKKLEKEDSIYYIEKNKK